MNIKKLCSFFGYSRQAYYKSRKLARREDKSGLISYIFQRRKELPFEGIRKLYKHINNQIGFRISRNTLHEFLMQNELIINKKHRYRIITNSSHNGIVSENYLRRNIPVHIFEVLVSDITYLRTKHQEYYLTAIMDLYARMILSYCLTNNLGADGLIRAFLMIIKRYKDKLKGCIFHSDRGIQYCSKNFRRLTGSCGVILSNSRKGNPYDNACMERLFATLKNEYMLKIIFPDIQTLSRAVKDAIYSYNNNRLHMSLDMLTPKQFFIANLKSY